MLGQPQQCFSAECPLAGKGRGFVLPSGPISAPIAILLDTPDPNDLVVLADDAEIAQRRKLYPDLAEQYLRKGVGGGGKSSELWQWAGVVAGINQSQVYLSHTLRCLPPFDGKSVYPTGNVRKRAEACCFYRDTSVLMADGTWKPIWRIKAGESVLTLEDYFQLTARKVLKQIKVETDHWDRWVEMKIDGAYNRGVARWGSPGVVCTDDHVWYGPDGEFEAQDGLGRKVYLSRKGSESLIWGMMLGDGYLSPSGRLTVSHSIEAYTYRKARHFDVRCSQKIVSLNGKKFNQWECGVTVPKYWHEKFYNGKQRLWSSPPDDQALAIWYCDDGSLRPSRCVKNTGTYAASFATHRFDEDGQYAIWAYMTRRFGDATLNQAERDGHRPNTSVLIPSHSASSFFAAIASYVPPEMEYKLPPKYRKRYCGWMELDVPQVGVVTAVEYKTFPTVRQRKAATYKYCLEVDGTHKFFTRGGLVANCRQYDRWDTYRPTVAVNSLRPDGVLVEPTPLPLQISSLRKARDFASAGERVVVLAGGKSSQSWLGYGSNEARFVGSYEIETPAVAGRREQRKVEGMKVSMAKREKKVKVVKLNARTALLSLLANAKCEVYPDCTDAVFEKYVLHSELAPNEYLEMLALTKPTARKPKPAVETANVPS